MKLKPWFFLFFIEVFFWLPGNSQSVEQTIRFAQEQAKFGNYEIAGKSWQRAAFFRTGLS